MMTTVLAMFQNYADAERVIDDLRAAGFAEDAVSIVASAEACPISFAEVQNRGPRLGKGILTGAAAGGAALAALAIPGIGPVLALGPMAAGLLGAGMGGVAGGIVAELRGFGVPEEDASCLCEAVRRGGTLVAVSTYGDDEATRATELLERDGVVDLDDCRTEWMASGWKEFDPVGEPVSQRPATERSASREGLPFDPASISPRARRARREKRAVRRYFRVR